MKRRPRKDHRWILVTGLSGAGKTTALKVLEDEGYFPIDNLPTALLSSLTKLLKKSKRHFPKVVLGMDAREKGFLTHYEDVLRALHQANVYPRIFFFEARPEVLIRRYSESRRPHPMAKAGGLARAIAEEARRLAPLKEKADLVFDTSAMNIHLLKQAIRSGLYGRGKKPPFVVRLVSFGFKHGLPSEADIVLDVRCFENPYFVPRLKRLDGRSPAVQRFVLGQKSAQGFLKQTLKLLKTLLPLYEKEGKSQLTVAFGCTGGCHRSVAIVEAVKKGLKDRRWEVRWEHRDAAKG
ncbi:MAG TPA: RNase adapter RapZ [bacterium]|nr:RNase adapter RapZ [bacterium]